MKKKAVLLTILFLFIAIFAIQSIPTAGAVPTNQVAIRSGPTTLVRLDPQARQRYVAPPATFLKNAANLEQVATATIIVNFNGAGWTSQAESAFRYAADIWETLITSSVPIVVDADFSPLDPGVLGGAGPTLVVRNFTNAPQPDTWYPIATANKLANTDHAPTTADIGATFSQSYPNWFFGTGSNTPSGKINFASVVLHELGHGLGFLGSMQVDDGTGNAECQGTAGEGCYGLSGFPMIYDRLTENGAGTPLLNFPNNSTTLGSELTSDSVYFDSLNANAANGDNRVPLYAPSSWNPGSSYSHLAESYNNTPQALMTFSIAPGETIHNPGSVTLCMFKDMGWTVSEACSVAPISGLVAENDSPTVLGNSTNLTATITSGSGVTYEWDFGDGNGDTGAAVSHIYAASGNYTATITATNSVSQDTTTTLVQVDSLINGLAAENDGPTTLGDSTHLTATISGGSNVSYEWDFGDGNSDTGATVSHTYSSPGSYQATITATNSVGYDTTTTLVQVDSLINGLAAENDGPTTLGDSTHLTATISGGSNVSYEWDFGDWNGDTGAEVSHAYAAPGEYTAIVTATNSVSQESTTTMVEIQDVPINGLAAANSSPTLLGDTTFLTATISSGSNVDYEWNFGDGNSDTGAEVDHIYTSLGEYTAVVTATNSAGQQSTSTLVQIVDVPIGGLAAENSGPTILGNTTSLTATISSGSNVTYEWSFGDGNGDSGAEVDHIYAAQGEYTAVVTATNSAGQQSTSTLVNIIDVPISGLTAENSSPTILGDTTFLTVTISGGSNVTYTWVFGDGAGDTGAEVSHAYAAPGQYTAVVTATNSAGQQSTSTLVQIVDVPISGLAAENDSPTTLGNNTQLTATISSGTNVTYNWAFGDGNSGNGVTVSHQYTAPGTYTATVTAINSVAEVSAITIVEVEAPLFLFYLPVISKP